MKLSLSFLVFTFLMLLISCGKRNSNASFENQREQLHSELPEVPQSDYGSYRTNLKLLDYSGPLNDVGVFDFTVGEESFFVQGKFSQGLPGKRHFQGIMRLKNCPEETDDLNQDGQIDFEEMLKVTGPLLVPLDSDLSSQYLGIEFGPVANSEGRFIYQRRALLTEMLMDLRNSDPDGEDFVSKLSVSERLNLDQRVLIIYTSFQDTFIPLACGKIARRPSN